MKKQILATALVFGLSPVLMAAPSKAKFKSQKKLKRIQKSTNQESLNNRKGKKYSAIFGVVGITHNAISNSFEGAYHYDTNTQFTLQYNDLTSGIATADEGKYSEDELRVWKRNGKGSSISAGIKHFTSNSFYLKGEVYYRNQDHINKTGSKVKPGTVSEWMVTYKDTARIEDIGLGFRIGNQWQWDRFTLGCDWAGINRSISTISKRGNLDSEDLNAINLLNFYIGASF